MKKLTKQEQDQAIIEQVEGMFEVNKIPLIVTPHLYKLAIKFQGKEWCEKYLVEDKPIK